MPLPLAVLMRRVRAVSAAPPPPPAAWTPDDLGAALGMWLDASDSDTITLVSGNVSQWDDKSGNNRDFTQGTAGNRPTLQTAGINGLDTIAFDGSNDALARAVESWAYDYPINVFVLFKAGAFTSSYNGLLGFYSASDASTAGYGVFIKSNGKSAIYATDTSDGQPNYDGTGALTYSVDTGYIFGATIRNDAIVSYGNGSADGSSSGTWTLRTNVGSGDVTVGSDPRFSRFTDWEIAEIAIVTGGAISVQNRQRMEGYLAWKWGLEASLPAGHPYENAAPTVATPGTGIVTDDLILELDAANSSSYPGTGATWFDLAGDSYDASLTVAPTYSSDDDGYFAFTEGDYLTLTNLVPIKSLTELSWHAVVWVDDVATPGDPGKGTFWSSGNGTDTDILFSCYRGDLFFQINNGADGSATIDLPAVDTWMDLQLVFNGAGSTNADRLKLYINGTQVTLSFAGYTVPASTTSSNGTACNIGRYSLSGSDTELQLDGRIAYTAFYNRALSGSEVTQNFDALKARYGL